MDLKLINKSQSNISQLRTIMTKQAEPTPYSNQPIQNRKLNRNCNCSRRWRQTRRGIESQIQVPSTQSSIKVIQIIVINI